MASLTGECSSSAGPSDDNRRINFGGRYYEKRHLGWQEMQDLGSSQRGGKLDDHRREARGKACQLIHGTSMGFVREKIASGIILVRTPEQTQAANDRSGGRSEYQAILVKGRLSYAFCEFVHGKYDRNKLDTVRQLVRNMTIEERLTIATLNFEEIWSRMWARKHMQSFSWRAGGMSHAHKLRILRDGWPPVDLQRDTLYVHRREKFHAAWLVDQKSNQLLKSLLDETTGVGQGRWEYPKGKRLDRSESDLSCAIREFREETQIPFENIRILPGFDRVEKYVHMNVLYINTFYLAVVDAPFGDPSKYIRLSNIEQTSEVSDIAWMGLADMRRVCGPAGRDLMPMGRAAFRYVRDYNKGKAPRLYVPPPFSPKRTGKKGRREPAPLPRTRLSQDKNKALQLPIRKSLLAHASPAHASPVRKSLLAHASPAHASPVRKSLPTHVSSARATPAHALSAHALSAHSSPAHASPAHASPTSQSRGSTRRQTREPATPQTRKTTHEQRAAYRKTASGGCVNAETDGGWQLVTRRPSRTRDGYGGERLHRPDHVRPGPETD